MPSMEELKAKAAAAAAEREKRDPATVVLPGLTQKQANDKLEASRAKNRNTPSLRRFQG